MAAEFPAPVRLVGFAAVLAAVLLVGYLGGQALRPAGAAGPAGGPAGPESSPHAHTPGDPGHGAAPDGHTDHSHADAGAGSGVSGLAVSAQGFTLVPETTTLGAGVATPFRFKILGRAGKPVTEFETVHDKQLHLIVVRRDLSGYQHLHPTLGAGGVWQIPLTLADGGTWRVYADFAAKEPGAKPGTKPVAAVLGIDLTVAGAYQPRPLPEPVKKATAGEYSVGYSGAMRTDLSQPLLFSVVREGQAVRDLQRYLAAYGHLVVLREGDLGYLHVHPEEKLVDGAVKFWVTAPSPGRYRMFFDFQHAGTVRTAEFTAVVG